MLSCITAQLIFRVNKGPNFVWHCDGYDKLKPFGFAIHSCIDGMYIHCGILCKFFLFIRYSRRVILMNCGKGNNDLRIILQYYINAVRSLQGIKFSHVYKKYFPYLFTSMYNHGN